MLNKREFIKHIYDTPCDVCPIAVYCKEVSTISCTSTAAHYFNSHTKDGREIKCPARDLRKAELNSN